MGREYRIGTRRSPLALRQVEEVVRGLRKAYPQAAFTAIGIETCGDRDKTTPISKVEGSDFFTKEIDDALVRGEIDFAVHSAKDLPDELPEGVEAAAVTKSIDPSDALVSRDGRTLDELPPGAAIGTSSARRKEQLKRFRDDFRLIDIRGTIEERLRLLKDAADECQRLDAIVIASCALVRLGLEHRISQRLPSSIVTPHPLQGSLAMTARADDRETIDFLKVLDER